MHKLGLVSLADRIVEANLLFLHKLIDGCIDAPSLLAQVGFVKLGKCNTHLG